MYIEDYYGWSTHQPLLRALLKTFSPKFILELGVGLHSTPIFIDYDPDELMCVENDNEWLHKIKTQCSFKKEHTLIFHDLGCGINLQTFLNQLNTEQKIGIVNYYKKLSDLIQNKTKYPKLMFVDNFTCCRSSAINVLYKNFDIVVYHDCEPAGIDWYEYYFVDDLKNRFNSYKLKSQANWTGCFINKNLNQDELKQNILPYISEYRANNKLYSDKIYLEKEY